MPYLVRVSDNQCLSETTLGGIAWFLGSKVPAPCGSTGAAISRDFPREGCPLVHAWLRKHMHVLTEKHRNTPRAQVLRGASSEELKAVKRVVWLAVNVAYNLRLEVSYLNDRRACLVPSLLPSFSSVNPAETVPPDTASSHAAAVASNASATKQPDGVGSSTDGTIGKTVTPAAASSSATTDGTAPLVAGVKSQPSGEENGGGAATGTLQAVDGGAVAAAAGGSVAGTAGSSAVEQELPAENVGKPKAEIAVASDATPADIESVLDQAPMLSSSLGVTFGDSPPFLQWYNAGLAPANARAAGSQRSKSADLAAIASKAKVATAVGASGGAGGGLRGTGNEHFAYENQNLMITSVWMTQGTQCCPADLKFIRYYTRQVRPCFCTVQR